MAAPFAGGRRRRGYRAAAPATGVLRRERRALQKAREEALASSAACSSRCTAAAGSATISSPSGAPAWSGSTRGSPRSRPPARPPPPPAVRVRRARAARLALLPELRPADPGQRRPTSARTPSSAAPPTPDGPHAGRPSASGDRGGRRDLPALRRARGPRPALLPRLRAPPARGRRHGCRAAPPLDAPPRLVSGRLGLGRAPRRSSSPWSARRRRSS